MKQLQKIILFGLTLALPLAATAQMFTSLQLNTISYRFVQEGWASTNTARVTVDFDAAVDQVSLGGINSQVLANMKKIADTNWHIVSFERTKDTTGLEKLHISVEARLPEAELAGLRDKAKAITKAGETYTVTNIDFTPSLAAMEQTRAALRATIYEQAKQEVARLSQANPGQKYFLNSIYFETEQPPVALQPAREMKTVQLSVNGAVSTSSSVAMSVNTKVTQAAQITVASIIPESMDARRNVMKPAKADETIGAENALNTR
ncbi:MAG: hypothetical protein K0Q74_242 [Gammaproteobacteria bacterium]|jgi:hypothetical protein|nr:hypothetical protein [Gammaproteobacteria bacterium]